MHCFVESNFKLLVLHFSPKCKGPVFLLFLQLSILCNYFLKAKNHRKEFVKYSWFFTPCITHPRLCALLAQS